MACGHAAKPEVPPTADTSMRKESRLSLGKWGRGQEGEQSRREVWGSLEPSQEVQVQRQDATPFIQLSGTYQVVTQTLWMSLNAKRANRRQRRTGEAKGDKKGGEIQNGNTRHSYVVSRRNLGLSESAGDTSREVKA